MQVTHKYDISVAFRSTTYMSPRHIQWKGVCHHRFGKSFFKSDLEIMLRLIDCSSYSTMRVSNKPLFIIWLLLYVVYSRLSLNAQES